MINSYKKTKIAVIARCKNEIDNLEEWIKNKKFSDLFLITDNDSSDGSFEFLSRIKNVIVKSVKGFDEGRDFQILLSRTCQQLIQKRSLFGVKKYKRS